MNRAAGTWMEQSNRIKAFVPNPLPPDPPLEYDDEMQSWLSRADWALARLDGISTVLPNPELFIAMYVKKEALLSSQIEGTEASLQGILEFEANFAPKDNVNQIKDVVNYIQAMNHGIELLKSNFITMQLIRDMHRILLVGVRGGRCNPGEFRTTQNWLGIPGASIREARFVPCPPSILPSVMKELEHYILSFDKTPPLIKTAMIHAQFETIHPFLDGNGRIGRLLITLYLIWKGLLSRPLLYLSIYLKRNRQQYYDLLMDIRLKGAWESWIKFFLRGVVETSVLAADTAREVIRLKDTMLSVLYERSILGIHAVKLLDYLFSQPVVNVSMIMNQLDISKEAANELVKKFEKASILKEITGQQRYKRYLFEDYMAIISSGTLDR